MCNYSNEDSKYGSSKYGMDKYQEESKNYYSGILYYFIKELYH